MREVWIVSAARTPVGSFNGALKSMKSPNLGAIAIKAAVERAGIAGEDVDECIMGCVLPAALGQAPARQAMIHAGLPPKVAALTINKVCGSGLKAVGLAAQAIQCGDADVIVAGGMESMTLAPHALRDSRAGYRMGPVTAVDCMVHDGLWDAYNDCHMGNFADETAKVKGYSREQLDAFTIDSYKKTLAAQEAGAFEDEIVPVKIPQRKGDPIVFNKDEEPARVKFEKIPQLRPAFNKDGVITAANASSINDGAAAVVVMAADKARELGIKPMVKIVSQAAASLEPQWFTMAPVDSIKNALKKAEMSVEDIDLFEINEAFSVVSLVTNDILKIDPAKVDVNGGAVAIGHPIGASGARVLVTLLYAMKNRGAKTGLTSLCIGGGEAMAMIVKAVE